MSAWTGLKTFTRMIFNRSPSRLFMLPRSRVDYLSEVGDGTGSSTVMAPLLWAARTFPEAPPALWRKRDDGQEDQVLDHPLLRLLQRPNPYFTGPILWMATIIDYMASGEAYWIKVRSRGGDVIELWWTPSWMVEPRGNNQTFITHYEYRPDGDAIEVPPEEIIHFRFGADPDDPRKGYSPLKSVLREVFTDDEAAAFTASLLRNMGVPGLMVSPEGVAAPASEDVDDVKSYMKSAFSGDRRGEPLVMSGPTKIQQFGFSPEQLNLKELRRIPEERVSAVTGVPAVVAGLGAGLDRSTFTNMGEAREMAYESTIVPMQRLLAEEIRFQLLAGFVTAEELWLHRFGFDLTKVRVLQEDVLRSWRRYDLAIRGGWAMVAEGRREAGLQVRSSDYVFLRQSNLTEVDGSTGKPTPLGGSNGNGNGGAHAEEAVRELVAASDSTRGETV